jgi:hypothetical protein
VQQADIGHRHEVGIGHPDRPVCKRQAHGLGHHIERVGGAEAIAQARIADREALDHLEHLAHRQSA